MIGAIKEVEAGSKIAELCRKHGTSGTTKNKYKTRDHFRTGSERKTFIAIMD
jgi:hypothetical protein